MSASIARTSVSPARFGRVLAERRARIFVVGGTIVGLYLLTRLLLFWRFPYFIDETVYARWALAAAEDRGERFISMATGYPPMQTWIGAALVSAGFEPLNAVRFISLVSGFVTLVMVFLIARRFATSAVAAAAAALFAICPFFVVDNVVGILEPLITAAAMCALYLQMRLAREPRLDTALLLGFALAIGVLTKPTGDFAVVLLPLSLVCFDWGRSGRWTRLSRWGASAALALFMTWAGYSLTKLTSLYATLTHAQRNAGLTRTVGDALRHFWTLIPENLAKLWPAINAYVTIPVLVLALLGLWLTLRSRRLAGLLLAGWALVPIVGACLIVIEPQPRYIMSAVPPTLILAAVGAAAAARFVWPRAKTIRFGRAAAAAVLFLALLPMLAFDTQVLSHPGSTKYPGNDDYGYATGWAAGQPWKPIANRLRERARARPIVVALGDLYSYALPLLLRHEHDVTLLRYEDEGANAADYLIETSTAPVARPMPPVERRLLYAYHRPRHGAVTRLYAIGVAWRGKFFVDPAGFRSSLGLSDADFDRFLEKHAGIRAWYERFYALHHA